MLDILGLFDKVNNKVGYCKKELNSFLKFYVLFTNLVFGKWYICRIYQGTQIVCKKP